MDFIHIHTCEHMALQLCHSKASGFEFNTAGASHGFQSNFICYARGFPLKAEILKHHRITHILTDIYRAQFHELYSMTIHKDV